MLLIEGKCPKCYGNLVLNEEARTVTCEDCGVEGSVKTATNLVKLLIHCGVSPRKSASPKEMWIMLKTLADEWGPKEMRQKLTVAGEIITKAYEEAEEPRGEEVMWVVDASRGLLDSKERLEELKKGGFIL